MLLPPKINVPATPALQDVDLNSLYDFTNAKLLGTGGFSQVMAVRHRPTGQMRALKIMQRAALRGKKKEMVAHEKEILRRACHPNVITLYETIQNSDVICLALDLMDEDLFELIVRNRRVNEDVTRMIMFQVLSAINYLHEQSIVHRDIKPENILINIRMQDETGGNNNNSNVYANAAAAGLTNGEAPNMLKGPQININAVDPSKLQVTVKIADFGLAKLVMEWDVRSTPCGTSFYIAPEVIRGIEAQGAKPLCTNQRLVKSVDVWSAGVVLYLLLSGRPPFHGQVKTPEERRALLNKINHGLLFSPEEVWVMVSDEAKDLLLRMLENNSAQRITAAEALRHPFFTRHGFTKPILGGDLSAMMREQAECARRHQLDLEVQQVQTQQVQQVQQYQPGVPVMSGAEYGTNTAATTGNVVNRQTQGQPQAPPPPPPIATDNESLPAGVPPLPTYYAEPVTPQQQQQQQVQQPVNAAINNTTTTNTAGQGAEYYYYSYGTAAVSSPNANQPPPPPPSHGAMAGHFGNTNTNANNKSNTVHDSARNSAAKANSGAETNSTGSGGINAINNTVPLTNTTTTNTNTKRSFFGSFAHLFGSGGSGSSSSSKRNKENNEKAMLDAVSEEEQKKLRDALAELQQEVIQADDTEGDETSYRVNMPVHTARPSRPAMMNTKVKVGPAALKKK